jgi:hypothetical protein
MREWNEKIDQLVNSTGFFVFTFILLVLLRMLVAAFSGYHGTDMQGQLLASRGLLTGRFLYTVDPAGNSFGYPPLHAYFQAFFLSLLGDTVLAAKMPAVLGDIGLGAMLYLLGRERGELFGRKLSLSYLIFPLSLLTSDVLGLFDSFALFLMFCALYFIEKERDLFYSIFTALGGLYKFFPLLTFFPVSIDCIRERKYRKPVFILFVIMLIGGAVFAPFLLTNLQETLQISLYAGAKLPDSFSLFRVFPVENEFLPFVYQVVAVSALYLMAIRWDLFRGDDLSRISLFTALFVMLNKNLYPQYFLWVFPFIALCFLKFHRDIELILILFIDTGILSIYWINLGNYVNSGPALPLLFQAFTWGVIGWAIYREYRSQRGQGTGS